MKGRLTNLTRGMDGEYQLTISTRDSAVLTAWDELRNTDIDASIKKWHKKRSLDANAYAWVLIDKLANVLNITKTEVYQELIRNIGGVSQTICCPDKAVNDVCTGWKHNGIGWFSETFPSKIDGCTNIILFFGSSTYDSKQMSALINAAVEECKQYGIETISEAERKALEDAWASCH